MLDDPPGIKADEDDAALVDFFFLPGGIFDADEDEQETSVENTELSSYVRRLSTRDASRIPSNPWGDDQLQENWTAAPSSVLVTGINDVLSSTGLAIPPPPGYGGPRIEENTTFDANQHDNNYMLASLPQVVQSPEAWKLSEFSQNGHHDEEATHQHHGHLLGTRVNGSQPPPGFQNRTIQRPSPGIPAGTASSVDDKLIADEGIENDISISARIEEGSAKVGLRVPPNVHAAPLETTNPYMAFLNDDDSSTSSSSNAENLHHRLVTKGSSSVATATEMDENDLEEIDDVNFDENEVEEDDNGQEIDISGQEEAAILPFQSFSFDKESYGDDSIISSVSSSNDDSDPDDSRRAIHYLLGENQRLDEVTLALNSEVAVKLDITDSFKETDPPSTETMGKASQCKRFESGEPPTNRKSDRAGPRNVSTANSTALLSEERPLPKNGSSRGSISRENVDATQTSNLGTILRVMDGRQVEWLQDLGEVLGAIAIALWKVLRRAMSFAGKFITIGGLFLLHMWKYAIIEFLEERKVATCYSVFYFLPHFCSAVMRSILAPHWTPHIITTFSVWLLCTKIQNSVVIGDTLSFDMITSIGLQRHGQIQVLPSRRLRDDQTCHTILRVLRYLLPFFLLIDGFSKEFGTIVGVSGASRLTAAFMMILVRKSLVSSPVCWVSWAVQVLITTYHPASFLVDALVLVSGLSSIRLVRYLESQNYAGGTGQLRREKRY